MTALAYREPPALVCVAPSPLETAFIILSGSYVGAELVAEFGNLPPSMLPNGGRPLYEAQCDMADALQATAILVLPHDFVLPPFDRERLDARGVIVVRAPAEANVLDSLRTGLIPATDARSTYLLFGDTLVPGAQSWPQDTFAAGRTNHVASWSEYREEAGACLFFERSPGVPGLGNVVAGFFHFGDSRQLAAAVDASADITSLLNSYSAVRPLSPMKDAKWLDFGHLFTYHQSRCRELLARSFNSVTSDGHSVVKSGTPARKIFAEAEWYRQLPARLRPFAPHFMGERDADALSYEVEYLYLPLMSELYSFAHLPMAIWRTMLGSCIHFLEMTHSITPQSHQVPADFANLFFDDMVGSKTRTRLRDFARERGLSEDEPWTFNGVPYLSLHGLADRLINMIAPTRPEDICLWHGDFHFGNIFYDFRSRKVRVVDPRGLLPNGMLTVYGDARYDISKLGHSIYGLYDLLIADRFHLTFDGNYDLSIDFGEDARRTEIIAEYSAMRIGRYSTADREAIAMVALLFLSMLPLHAKDRRRQTAILANAMRLTLLAEAAG